jgi:hypothetical protein
MLESLAPFARKPCDDPECVGPDCVGKIDLDNALIASCDMAVIMGHELGLTFAELIRGLATLAKNAGMELGIAEMVVADERTARHVSDRLPRASSRAEEEIMSTTLLDTPSLNVTSYCGPIDVAEPTRMRLQIGDPQGTEDVTLAFSDACQLYRVLGAWIRECAGATDPVSENARVKLDERNAAALQGSSMAEAGAHDTAASAQERTVARELLSAVQATARLTGSMEQLLGTVGAIGMTMIVREAERRERKRLINMLQREQYDEKQGSGITPDEIELDIAWRRGSNARARSMIAHLEDMNDA